jgi:hypothetical protein
MSIVSNFDTFESPPESAVSGVLLRVAQEQEWRRGIYVK